MNASARPTCTAATISLIFGIVSWFALPVIGAVVAIVCGHMARSEIRRTPGGMEGDGLAVAGLVLGYLHLALAALVILAVLLFFGGLAALIAFGHGAAAFVHHVGHP